MNVYDFVKHGLLPGSLGLLLLGLVLGLVALRFARSARGGACILVVFIASYWAMSVPTGAWLLGRVVSTGYSSLVKQVELADVQAIVVLDASTNRYGIEDIEITVISPPSAIRAAEAVRLYRRIQPSLVVVSGGAYRRSGKVREGEALRDQLVAAGVPADRLVLDAASRNTHEHALNVSALLRARGVVRFALVTSSVHMRRAMRAFSGTGLQVVAAPAPVEKPGAFPWWPNSAALDRSWEAWYEVFGLLRDFAR